MSSEKRERSYQRPEDPTNSALTSARQQEQVEVPAASSGSLQQGAVPLHLIQEQQQHRKRRERVSSISGQDQTVTAVSAAAAAGGGRRYEETAGALSAPQTCGAKGGGVRQQEPSSSSKDRPSYSGHKQPEEFQLQRGSTDYSSAEYAKRGVNGGQGRGGSSLTLPIEERGAVSGRRERSPVRRRTDLVPDSNAPGASPPSRASSSLRPDFIPRSTTPRPPSIRRERGGERGRDRERESREAYREAYADSVGRHSMTGREKTRERELASASSPRRLSPSPSSRVRVVAPGDRAEREWIADGGRDRQNSHTKMVIPPQNLQVRQRQVRPFRRSQSPRYESATSHHVDMDNVRSSKGPSVSGVRP
uniref:Uncharacterized protein n=1 Tax=Chromera velia CCMP2878 TaxID=1169474 RepID=A0A0G4HYW6_9ALVE|eukprot:Cvel_9593.t1-p1 / transcript=Cvel_9593.t1 / gene=Cvel_9593 / organism=Chromera_velia_CCMP2878 / gene_product=hypothetical protein / transcript_product=hypothetical protein / location=Cvel_scaffold556:78606-79776(+) / protein_length=362 / sequence_SO=supercontig / SO=protein_coding / is_pseudo=false